MSLLNSDFNPEPDPDGDPLLDALRRQLGPGFGQVPPPRVWTGIRQQLAPRPWWRRPRRLLPALALLLGLSATVAVLVARRPAAVAVRAAAPTTVAQHATQLHQAAPAPPLPAAAQVRPASSALTVAHQASRPVISTMPLRQSAPATAPVPTAHLVSRPGSPTPALPLPMVADSIASPASRVVVGTTAHGVSPVGLLPGAASKTRTKQVLAAGSPTARRHRKAPALITAPTAPAPANQHLAAVHSRTAATARFNTQGTTPGNQLPAAPTRPVAAFRRGHPIAGQARPASQQHHTLGLAAAIAAARRLGRQENKATETTLLPAEEAAFGTTSTPGAAPVAEPRQLVEVQLLPLRRPGLPGLSAVALPATLPVLPDSSRPQPPFRRWSLQVLAGPTLSYRSVPSVYNAGSPNYAGYERPALGWGAQVQVRRVLSGRWAAALGLGYHEYATQLNLLLKQPGDSAGRPVRQRDTYQLLTLPLQATYALAPRRGPWQLALLGGTELGWYQGGRTTEASGCACQQQTFTQASGSPYNSLSVTLSLGLDLRYYLGGAASRWQLLAQPSGRYVATPFVRDAATSYVRRQPYSLGVLLGLAWAWR